MGSVGWARVTGQAGGSQHARWAPLLARLAQAQIISQVRHDLPLRHNILVSLDEHISYVRRHCQSCRSVHLCSQIIKLNA